MNCILCKEVIARNQSDELCCNLCGGIEFSIPKDICWSCSWEKHVKEEHNSVDLI